MRRFIPFLIFLCALIAADMMAVDGAAGTIEAAPEPGPARGPEWYFDQASEAADQEFYDRAVRLFKEGQERFPLDIPLRVGLGDLYTDQHLFTLALDEYRAADKIDHEDYEVLYRLGETLGYLTRDSEAVEVFERLNRLYPDDSYVLADLGCSTSRVTGLKRGSTSGTGRGETRRTGF